MNKESSKKVLKYLKKGLSVRDPVLKCPNVQLV
jgi:hypothetical protein